ncbi:tfuA-like family protein [Synechococcus sp. MEDNS5]|uniref:TfuA-like protein n=1 Tax=Synechococcus sp. MEDNS5 TaxID=1442554 RepID=UPI0016489B25|nr:TfuA-like protein [Synechococcus sp. MEDNS5]QNJ06875.1 tfuA-like family protein [Synechococcus sp. MEDNS5]
MINPKTAVYIESTFNKNFLPKLNGVDYLPAVKKNDIYRDAEKYDRFLIVDGVFATSRAVWQREIIHAITIGKTVLGCSSIGALRAAELGVHGMIGSGWVYKNVLSATIEGDDEVSLLYSVDPSGNIISYSVPMATIMWILSSIYGQHYLSDINAAKFLNRIKSKPFNERTFSYILNVANNMLPLSVVNLLKFRLQKKEYDIKSLDFINLLGRLYNRDLSPLLETVENLYYE